MRLIEAGVRIGGAIVLTATMAGCSLLKNPQGSEAQRQAQRSSLATPTPEGGIPGKDYVSPVIQKYIEAVKEDAKAEYEGLSEEEIELHDKCISGFLSTEECQAQNVSP